MEFVGGDYATLAETAGDVARNGPADLIVRNATWFPPMTESGRVPTISLLQDIITDGPQREMQEAVIKSSASVVYNSEFTASKYENERKDGIVQFKRIIPLPVDFSLFQPASPMGLQQALGLPDGCILWVGASQGAAGQVKGWDIFLRVVRANPDLPFVAAFKDRAPDIVPPNLRVYERLPHVELVKVMGACCVGLCTSRTESQHLAGIEMGACGLPMVAPPVGVYWNRKDDFPGFVMKDGTEPRHYATAVRLCMSSDWGVDVDKVRAYWRKEFSPDIIRAQWLKLIEEVECSGR